jgi:hypothetical protein
LVEADAQALTLEVPRLHAQVHVRYALALGHAFTVSERE